jgi:uncharacterized membrane protein YdjX (TVP38/TMEM64 family)
MTARRIALVLGLCVGLALAAHLAGRDLAAPALALLRAAHRHGQAGLAVVFAVQAAIAASGILPASVLGIAAGALFGVAGGFAAAAGGTMAGALVAFGLARSLLRPWIARFVGERPALAQFDRALGRDGWRLVCLVRMSPVMPFAVTSYALGLSAVGFRAYALGTLAALPALAAYVVAGEVAGFGALHLGAGVWAWAGLALGGGATLALAWYLARTLRRACTAA